MSKTQTHLSLERPLRHREHIVLLHLCADPVRVALHVLERELDLVLRRDVLPRGQEHLLLHGAVLGEEDVDRENGGKVEHVNVVLDGDLE